jgi:hypothetical protein
MNLRDANMKSCALLGFAIVTGHFSDIEMPLSLGQFSREMTSDLPTTKLTRTCIKPGRQPTITDPL